MGGPLLLQRGGQTGIAPCCPPAPVLPGQKAGVEVVGKQNGGGTSLPFCRPHSGQQDTAQQDSRSHQPAPASQQLHCVPPSFHIDLTALILPQNPSFRKRDFTPPPRSAPTHIQYSVKISNIISLKISTVFPMIFPGRIGRHNRSHTSLCSAQISLESEMIPRCRWKPQIPSTKVSPGTSA